MKKFKNVEVLKDNFSDKILKQDIENNFEKPQNDFSPCHQEKNEMSDHLIGNSKDLTRSNTPSHVIRPLVTLDKRLNEIEVNKLMELSKAASYLMEYEKHTNTKKIIEIDDLAYYCQQFATTTYDNNARSTVNFVKGISKFNEIVESDRVALFKHSCWKLFALKKLPAFDFEKEHWTLAIVSILIL